MSSRMDRYYNASSNIGKRSQKNEKLYKEVSKQNLEDFNVTSNATVLSDNGTNIDLDRLRDLLNQKYQETNKRKTINLDIPYEDEEVSLDETKEYDINAILEKARENKTVDYEKERLKKVRDTQYDILKNLDFNKKEEVEEEKLPTAEEEKLMTLINTITINEQNSKKDLDPLDLFKDLKGSENTQVIEGVKEEVTKEMPKPLEKTQKITQKEAENQIDNSFYTNSFKLSKKDFEDFEDLEGDVKSSKVLVIILTVIIILALLFGIFLFLNIYFEWGII